LPEQPAAKATAPNRMIHRFIDLLYQTHPKARNNYMRLQGRYRVSRK
jgi:hypothetical protein